MSILYAIVAQGPVVLARYASCAGNFQEVSEQILSQVNVDSGPRRMTYTHDHYLTHYVISHGIIYLCMTEDAFDRYRAFLFLDDIKDRFKTAYQASPRDHVPYVWDDVFAEVLKERMQFHNTNPNVDQVTTLRSQVQDVQETLVRNIEELANRGERLELLVDKTNKLDTASVIFRSQTQQVARRAWWAHVKMGVYIALILALSIYLLGAVICGFSWDRCPRLN